jgi:RND family efflux transporter MFP subunit
VRPRTETILSAEVSGAIVGISPKFIPGGVFEADEVLLRIDPTNYQVALEQAEALLAQRQIEFDGALKLRSQGYRAESEFASAAAALASAKAELVRAQRNLDRTRIRLPYAGMVRGKEADLGQYVSVGSRLGVTFATDVAEIRLPLTDQDLAFIDLPDVAEIAASGSGDGPTVTLSAEQHGRTTFWEGRIVRTEGVVDETTRVTYAVASVADPYRRNAKDSVGAPLPIGTFVAARIEGTTVQDVLRIPRSAVRGNGQLVVVDDENRLEIRDVEILRADANFAYVQNGVAEGERISLTVIENPINGMRVRTEDETVDRQLASGEDDGEETR